MTKSLNLNCWIYLLLAIAGAILPTLSNIEYMKAYGPGFDISNFIALANINPAASSLSRDLVIGATSIFIWIINESKKLQMKNLWIVILGTFTIAFAFSAPLFLFLRELRLLEIQKKN
tara:strand:+ start:4419 stop:4772 length:354 start_codon:yes stop_codon:yes gene_type:complete